MTEFKSARFEIKAVSEDKESAQGVVKAYVSMFGNVDYGGDRMVAGAFDETLKEWNESGDPIPVIWSHQWDNPEAHVGVLTSVESDETGLLTEQKYDLTKPFAKQVFDLLKSRRVREFSFGFIINDAEMVDDAEYGQVREIKSVKLIEVGPTLVGMNPATQLLEAASLTAKAGRTLSGKNESELRKARDIIDSVLAAVESDTKEISQEPDASVDEPVVETDSKSRDTNATIPSERLTALLLTTRYREV